jgi:hypothetical protein
MKISKFIFIVIIIIFFFYINLDHALAAEVVLENEAINKKYAFNLWKTCVAGAIGIGTCLGAYNIGATDVAFLAMHMGLLATTVTIVTTAIIVPPTIPLGILLPYAFQTAVIGGSIVAVTITTLSGVYEVVLWGLGTAGVSGLSSLSSFGVEPTIKDLSQMKKFLIIAANQINITANTIFDNSNNINDIQYNILTNAQAVSANAINLTKSATTVADLIEVQSTLTLATAQVTEVAANLIVNQIPSINGELIKTELSLLIETGAKKATTVIDLVEVQSTLTLATGNIKDIASSDFKSTTIILDCKDAVYTINNSLRIINDTIIPPLSEKFINLFINFGHIVSTTCTNINSWWYYNTNPYISFINETTISTNSVTGAITETITKITTNSLTGSRIEDIILETVKLTVIAPSTGLITETVTVMEPSLGLITETVTVMEPSSVSVPAKVMEPSSIIVPAKVMEPSSIIVPISSPIISPIASSIVIDENIMKILKKVAESSATNIVQSRNYFDIHILVNHIYDELSKNSYFELIKTNKTIVKDLISNAIFTSFYNECLSSGLFTDISQISNFANNSKVKSYYFIDLKFEF